MEPVTPFSAPAPPDGRNELARVVHLLSQPLTVLRGSLELALLTSRKAADLRAGLTAALEQAEEMVQMLSLLRELTETKIETEDRDLLSLGEVAAEITDALQPLAASRHMELQLKQTEDLAVRAPRLRFRQALMRVMHAAVSTGPAGGILHVATFGSSEYGCVEIGRHEVSPVPPMALHPLTPTLELIGGRSGLECLVAMRAINRIGGKVYTDGPPLQASLCRICLPLAAAVPAGRLAPVASAESAPDRESQPRVQHALPLAAVEIRRI